jgi:DNA processing protein
VRGSIVDRDLAIALVGARAADRAALDTARRLGREIVARGGLVVSGGAIGVDGAAHRGALDGGGPTVAVLGCGIDVVYPLRHRGLYEEMVAGGGALVSPFPPGTPPRAFHFVRRNAIIAALADAVVVVAATGNSGSLHTARAAAALGRPVCAVPGTDGCERLLATGAAVVESAEDIARAVAGEPRRRAAPAPGGQAAGLLAALDPRDPRDEEQLSVLTGLSLREVAGLLCDLELQGLAILLPGGNYVRSPLAPATESRS